MKVKNLLIAATLFVSSASIISAAPEMVSAAPSTSMQQNVSIKNTSLTKQGYIVRLKQDSSIKVYVGKGNYKKLSKSVIPLKNAKTVSTRAVKNVKFRIEKIAYMKSKGLGAPEYLIASKNKKYSTWVTQADLEYYYLNSKSMKNVKKYLTRIAKRYSSNADDPRGGSLKDKKNLKDFNSAVKAAKKLPAKQRKFVLKSLAEQKKVGNTNEVGNNILFFSIF
ncbi:hypothetical protein J2Z60_000466 [Lactobacillus colini]|uniref:Surface layer protein A domain-containing protein n=1 Tax=Lactobacillus colini TaxID=1819254 RepID=A0ABS4MD39_9LACO|nr:hypothetical protein [Lactobacillus colini]MBP2057302.1 hypothetical protein [Lactobacillus colini]